MTVFDKLFISFYNYYKPKRADAKFAAVCSVTAIQIFIVAIPLLSWKVIFQSQLLSSFHTNSKIISIPITAIWFLINFLYYKKNKVIELTTAYEQMSLKSKSFWKWAPLILFLLFVIALFTLVIVNKHMQKG